MSATAYKVLTAGSAKELTDLVQASIDDGDQPLGAPFVDSEGRLHQAVCTGVVAIFADASGVTLTKGDVGLGNVSNDAQLKAADLDTDATMAANSDTKIASQKATKTALATKAPLANPTFTSPSVVLATGASLGVDDVITALQTLGLVKQA